MSLAYIFTLILTYGGAVAGLLAPYLGVLVYISLAVIRPGPLWWQVPPASYSEFVAIPFLLGWGIKGFGDWNWGRSKAIVFAFLGMWLWAGLCLFISAQDHDLGVKWLSDMSRIIVPYFVGLTLITKLRHLTMLAWTIFLGEGVVCLVLNLEYFAGNWSIVIDGPAGMGRAIFSTGGVAVIGLGLALFFATRKVWGKVLVLGVLVFILHAVFLSFSRGGMLGMIMVGLAAPFFLPRKATTYVLLGAGLVLGLAMAGPEIRERFQTIFASEEERDGSAQGRLNLWADMSDALVHQPIFGLGPNNWPPHAYNYYGWERYVEGHNYWLQTGSELGFPGLALLLTFYGLLCFRLVKLIRRPPPDLPREIDQTARMVVLALTGFAICAWFVTVEQLEPPYYINLLGAGALKLSERDFSDPTS